MTARTLKLTIAALGGQGGGVLTDWLIEIAEHHDYIVQATSVPGVAQRTGATIYYLEFFPRAAAAGREPIMALMPVAGDVDCVVASELAEAGRAVARGLVSGQTTLIASTHRAYAIAEKSALGDGTSDARELLELVRGQGRRAVVFDMEATAQRHGSVISAVLLGAISGAAVLPFPKAAFAAAISGSGLAVDTNLAAFAEAHRQAESGARSEAARRTAELPPVPERARTAALQPLLERLRRLPTSVQPWALEGARRMLDYQDADYAQLYLARVERIAALDGRAEQADGHTLTQVTARALALWMTFEDTIRVADLKTRGARVVRVASDSGARPGQLFGITDFMRPRVAEIAGTLPAGIGARLLRSSRLVGWLSRCAGGKQIRTRTVCGFLLLRGVAGLRRFRRGTLRFREEDGRIEAWLEAITRHTATHYALAVELARAQRLIKGYGETHERGWRNFCALVAQLQRLGERTDGAALLARLAEAALADEEGAQLAREIAALDTPATNPAGQQVSA